MTPRRFHRLREVLDRRQPDLTVVLERVHKAHNLSAIVRTADAVGIFEVHAVAPIRVRPARAVAQGTGRWVRVYTHATVGAACESLAAAGMRVVAAHPGPSAVDYRELDYTAPLAILFGQEKEGVSEAALRRADAQVVVPMQGMVVSLNVSVAAALILYEAWRQREAAGLYAGDSRLDPDVRRRTLFEWAYPQLADLCRRTGADYPELGEDGEIVGEIPRGPVDA